MSERVINGTLIQSRPSAPAPAIIADVPIVPGEIIATAIPIEPPSTIIVVSPAVDVMQYAQTAGEYVVGNMDLNHVERAKNNTGGYSVKVPRMRLSQELIVNAKRGDIITVGSGYAVIGDKDETPFIVTSQPIHPFTGEALNPPHQPVSTGSLSNEYTSVQIAPSPNIQELPQTTSISQLPTTPSVSYNNNDLQTNPFLGPLKDL